MREHLPEVQLSAVLDNNRDGEKPSLVGVYSQQYALIIILFHMILAFVRIIAVQ